MGIFSKAKNIEVEVETEDAAMTLKLEDILAGKDPVYNDLLKRYNDEKAKSVAIRDELSKKAYDIKIANRKRRQATSFKDIDINDIDNILDHASIEDEMKAAKLKQLSKMSPRNDTSVLKAKRNVLSYLSQFVAEHDSRVNSLSMELKRMMDQHNRDEILKENQIVRTKDVLDKLLNQVDEGGTPTGFGPRQVIKNKDYVPASGGEGAIQTALAIIDNNLTE